MRTRKLMGLGVLLHLLYRCAVNCSPQNVVNRLNAVKGAFGRNSK